VWDVVIDPLIGAASDRQLVRTGSRRGFMLTGALTLPLFFALTFAVPPSWGPAASAICVLLAFLGTATAFSLFQVPYVALPAELTGGYDERTRLLGWRVVVLTASILLFGAGGPMLRRATGDQVSGYLLMGIAAGVVIGLGMLVATRTARTASTARLQSADETARNTGGLIRGMQSQGIRDQYLSGFRALRRSEPFRALLGAFVLQALATGTMLAGAQYVARWVLGDEAAVEILFVALVGPALIATPGWTAIANRTGKERAFLGASILFLIASASIIVAVWAPGEWLYAAVAAAGIAYAGLQSLPMAMLPDVISHDARVSGDDADKPGQAGTFTGIWTAGETVGFALGATAVSLVLAATGYVSTVAGVDTVQPDAAVTGIVLSFSILPAVLMALSILPLTRYRLRRSDIDGTREHTA
jgi:Na+/melibiose symporter-like transporter